MSSFLTRVPLVRKFTLVLLLTLVIANTVPNSYIPSFAEASIVHNSKAKNDGTGVGEGTSGPIKQKHVTKLAPFTISSTSNIQNGCNCVIFRLDDVQDYWINNIQTTVMNQFIQKNQPLTVGIIMDYIGDDVSITNKVNEGYSSGLFELAVHGWDHVDYSQLNLTEQTSTLQNSNDKMKTLFGNNSNVFIPPYDIFSDNSLVAMKSLGYKIISPAEWADNYPHYVADGHSKTVDNYGVYHLQESIGFVEFNNNTSTRIPNSQILSAIDSKIASQGYAVVTLHAQDFRQKINGVTIDVLNQTEIQDLNSLLDSINSKNYHIRTFNQVINFKQANIATVTTQMNDSVASFGLNAYSVVPIQTEYISSSSSLVGKSIDNIVVGLKKFGSPVGAIQVGVFNNDQSVKQLFGTINTASITTTGYSQYSFSLPVPQSYKIQSGDRIGIKFTGGSTANTIGIMTDQINAFDGTTSYLTSYDTIWRNYTGKDLYMTLNLHEYSVSPTVFPTVFPTVSITPPAGTYIGSQSVVLTASIPGTIYYTTDGSTPTTYSTNSPSPVLLNTSTNSTLKFFAKDVSNNASPIGIVQYTILLPVITQMNDSVASFGLNTNSAIPIQAEYISNSSSLIGKSIDTIVVSLKKVGSPLGTIQVGVFNKDQSIKQLFGTINASSVTTAYKQFSTSLPAPQNYQLQLGDRIGIKFTGGNSTNTIGVMTDQTNAFDGTTSYLTSYDTMWRNYIVKDLYMTLKLRIH